MSNASRIISLHIRWFKLLVVNYFDAHVFMAYGKHYPPSIALNSLRRKCCACLIRRHVSDRTDKMMIIMMMTLFVCNVSLIVCNVHSNVSFVCIGMSSEFRRSFETILAKTKRMFRFIFILKKKRTEELKKKWFDLILFCFVLFACTELTNRFVWQSTFSTLKPIRFDSFNDNIAAISLYLESILGFRNAFQINHDKTKKKFFSPFGPASVFNYTAANCFRYANIRFALTRI